MSKPTVSAAGGAMPAEGHKTRRAALRLFGAAPALAILPALANSPVDPVFAAIERHKVAWAAFVETCDPLDNVEGEQEGTKEELAYMEASGAADEALAAFLATPPTTLAGLHAALAYAVEVDSDCMPDNSGRIAETLLRSPLFAGMGGEGRANV
jgi:hypothetical protein